MPTLQRTHIASSTPNRTRIKVSEKRRNHREMERISKALKASPEVHDVQTNVQTGSIVVMHNNKPNSQEKIAATLQNLGVVLGYVTNLEVHSADGKSETASNLVDAIADLNKQVGQATNGLVDLRVLVPAGLGALAVRQLLRNGLQVEAAPWYVLAYYAFDSFIKLHYTHDEESSTSEKK